MSLAATFNKSLQRKDRDDQHDGRYQNRNGDPNLNNHNFLDETTVSPQSPTFEEDVTKHFHQLSLNNRGSYGNSYSNLSNHQHSNHGYPSSPKSPFSFSDSPMTVQSSQFATPVNQVDHAPPRTVALHSPNGNLSPSSPMTPTTPSTPGTGLRVPTSFMRHGSDSRVSYIDSAVTKANNVYTSPSHSSTNSSKRNSQLSAVTVEAFETDPKRKSFAVFKDSQLSNPHHETKVQKLLQIPANTPQELKPILTLFNSQQARVYKSGRFSLTIERIVSNARAPIPPPETIQCEAVLSGNELSVWDYAKDDSQPIYINVADASFINNFDTNTIKIINTSSNHYHLHFESFQEHKAWFSALVLSYFEFSSLHEAYTGALLSAKAIHMNDIKTIMAETRYSVGEWCNLKLNYLSSRWIKVYVVVAPKQKDNAGHVSIYSSDKIGNKKNLIMVINKGFSCVSVYPLIPEAIDNFSEIKIEGEITVHNWKFLLSKGVKNDTAAMLPPSPIYVSQDDNSKNGRSRSSSFGSLKIGRKRSSLSLNSSGSERVGSTATSVSSQIQNSASSSLANIASSNPDKFTSSFYLLPENHPGVANFETMVRLLIPLFDAFELYGRPKKLEANRTSLNGLLFALPSLPKSRYLDVHQVEKMVSDKIAGIPMYRDPDLARYSNNKKVITKTTIEKKTGRGRSKSLFSKLKKPKTENEPLPIPTQAVETITEYTNSVPVESWTNREWLLFLKYELKYLLSTGYEGSGSLSQDFNVDYDG